MTREIILAIDPESEEAEKVVAWSLNNFLRASDHVNLVTMLYLDVEFVDHDYSLAVDEKDILQMEEKLKAKFSVGLEKLRTDFEAAGISNVTIQLLNSESSGPCQRLIEHLDTIQTDCLIMGSRNLSGWKRLFMGSFSEYIQTHVHCPVLIVK
ncbi:hypothetical protein BDB00DRAFT_818537 [Zychaea mexicana]|uniref:uncharacterized protein n=1 Tax=Zychaea mexicana TaxID=64656 RepID=UPI0022FE4B59|nr:uncharacterized protein BDB00DRAFT_818537 [Zychaea mexicana]KAI9494557.1 hypothetical protein BDB00DRAFT_818537 [Zychaea mexicana]